MSYKFSAIVEKEGKWYVALCPEMDIAGQGRTIEDALSNLKEAVRLYMGTASREEVRSALRSHPLITTLEVTV